jgi:diphthamide biosynthesis enzyme Dph1/Dph2-like protein
MKPKPLANLEQDYDLELARAVKEIKKQKAKRVLLQVPDFFKPYATQIADKLEKATKVEVFIYFGSCFGACDIPTDEAKAVNCDMIIQLGHSNWDFKDKKEIQVLK